MAVQPQTPYIEHTANGITKSFNLEFDCENQDHLIVLVDDVEPVVGTWSLSGGAVVFGTTPDSGKKITIQRNTPFRRDEDFQSYDNSFRPPGVNKGFDKIWLKLQELGVSDYLVRLYVDRLHREQKEYIDQKDDELKNYLLDEIEKQGVALDQLEDYYNYLMERLAQIAVDKGWDASFVVDGDKNQHQINTEQKLLNDDFALRTSKIFTPEHFGAKANDSNFDSTAAFIAAFASGKDIYGKAGDRYYIRDGISTKGQRLHGGFELVSWLEVELIVKCEDITPDKSKFRAMYVSTSSDIVDFLKMRELGINTIIHYMHNTTSDRVSERTKTLKDVLDTAKTANLDVVVSVEDWVVTPDLATWVALAESYSNVVGFYLYDEPASAGNIPVTEQDARITEMRALTKLPLYVCENHLNVFEKVELSSNFDVYLVDVYTSRTSLFGLPPVEATLGMASACFLQFKQRYPKAKVFPIADAYYRPGDTAQNKTDVSTYSSIWSQVAGGNFVYFAWDARSDPSITPNAKGSTALHSLIASSCHAVGMHNYSTDGAFFGRVKVDIYDTIDDGTVELNNRLQFHSESDVYFKPKNCIAGSIKGWATADAGTRTFNTSGTLNSWDYLFKGLIFRGSEAVAYTDIKVFNLNAVLVLRSALPVTCDIGFYESHDDGYTLSAVHEITGVSDPNQISFFRKKGTGGNLVILIRNIQGMNSTDFRAALIGCIVSSNW